MSVAVASTKSAPAWSRLGPEIRPLVENLRSVMINHCGHYLAEEQPERVVEELRRFFHETTETTP